jgi:hypothetical protein
MRKPLAICLVLVVAVCGCGTVRNLASSDPEPYGGWEKDQEFFNEYWPHPTASTPTDTTGFLSLAAICTAPLLPEIIATVVGDTLTLPITRAIEARNHPDRQAERQTEWIDGPVQYSTNVPEDAIGGQ